MAAKSLVERSPLSNSVINVLIHYVLVVQNNAALPASYVNNIAAQWSELQVKPRKKRSSMYGT